MVTGGGERANKNQLSLTSKEKRGTVQGETEDRGKGQKLETKGAATAGNVGGGQEREVHV